MEAALKREGSLAQRDFAELVQHLSQERWSGVLTLSSAGIGRSITVIEGRLVFASSTSPDERLGELLLRQGRISLQQFVEAGKSIGPGKRLGTILVEQGLLAPKDLVKAVTEQTQEIIYAAFQGTEGQYRLQESAASAEAITLKISTPDLIMEGIRRIESWHRISRAIGGFEARYERADTYEATVGQMHLSFEKLSLLTALNGVQDVGSICRESTLPDFEVCRTLWAFRVVGVVRRVDVPDAAPSDPEDEGLDYVLNEE